jgi:hypothetical protein
MTLRLNGSTSGYTEIDAPAVAGNNNLKLPTGNGSDGNILGTDGAGNLSWVNGRMVLATAQNTTSSASIDFTGIPSWVKKITVMLNGVSTSGTSTIQIQLGTGVGPTFTASGYLGGSFVMTESVGNASEVNGTGFRLVANMTAAHAYHGIVLLSVITGNTWALAGNLNLAGGGRPNLSSGSVPLAATLTAVRLTTVNGTDTFDAGSINILYEG